MNDETTDLDAVAGFLDWLCDHGYVVAELTEKGWNPIDEGAGVSLGAKFALEYANARVES